MLPQDRAVDTLVTRPTNVVSGKASIVTSTESPMCSRTTSVSSTCTFTWITDKSEIVSNRAGLARERAGHRDFALLDGESGDASGHRCDEMGLGHLVPRLLQPGARLIPRDAATPSDSHRRCRRPSAPVPSARAKISWGFARAALRALERALRLIARGARLDGAGLRRRHRGAGALEIGLVHRRVDLHKN